MLQPDWKTTPSPAAVIGIALAARTTTVVCGSIKTGFSQPAGGVLDMEKVFVSFFFLQNGRSVDAASSYWRVVLTSGGGFHRGGVGDQPPVWASSFTFPRRFGPSTATPSGTGGPLWVFIPGVGRRVGDATTRLFLLCFGTRRAIE